MDQGLCGWPIALPGQRIGRHDPINPVFAAPSSERAVLLYKGRTNGRIKRLRRRSSAHRTTPKRNTLCIHVFVLHSSQWGLLLAAAPSEIGEFIERVKFEAGVTSDAALATELGVSKPTISSWRQRGHVPEAMQRTIHRRFNVVLDENAERILRQRDEDMRLYIAALMFVAFDLRSKNISLGPDQVDNYYWWAKRFPYLNVYFREELLRRVDGDRRRSPAVGSDTSITDPTGDELDLATREITNDIKSGRLLLADELEAMPYRR